MANQSNVSTNLNNSPNNHPTTSTTSVTTATNVHHNSLINANQTPHYQRHDFKNRRSSSEPANEQKVLAHIQSNPNNVSSNISSNYCSNQNNTTTNTSIINSTNNSNSLVLDDATTTTSTSHDIQNPGDDFIDCLHQKNIKVSKNDSNIKEQKKSFFFYLTFLYFLCVIYTRHTQTLLTIVILMKRSEWERAFSDVLYKNNFMPKSYFYYTFIICLCTWFCLCLSLSFLSIYLCLSLNLSILIWIWLKFFINERIGWLEKGSRHIG